MITRQCRDCRFSFKTTSWICRRYPPTALELGHSKINSAYPVVVAVEWCGEYLPNQDGCNE